MHRVLVALERVAQLRRILPAHREHLGHLAAQEVLADAAVGRAASVGVAGVPAAQREREAVVEQHHHRAEQHQGHHHLDQREPAGALPHCGLFPSCSVAREMECSFWSAPRQSTRVSMRKRAKAAATGGSDASCVTSYGVTVVVQWKRGSAESPCAWPSFSASSMPATAWCERATSSALERSSSAPARARPPEKISKATENTRASSAKATTTSINVKPLVLN